MSLVVCLSFATITYSVGANDVTGLEAFLEDEEPSIRLVKGFWELE